MNKEINNNTYSCVYIIYIIIYIYMYTSVCIISEFQGKHVNGHSKDGECIIQNNLRHVWNIFTIWR